jgi:hypothetical protein
MVSVLLVLPYARQPWELGYPNLETLLVDQFVMCLGIFSASVSLRPVCRSLTQRPLPWTSLELRALGWSVFAGTTTVLLFIHLITGTPDLFELLEACVKISAVLFLWCNLYFSIKHYQKELRDTGLSAPVYEETRPPELAADSYAARFSVRTGSRVQIVSVQDVEWIAAAGDYSEFHTRAGVYLLRETMNSLEQRLDPARFARIHRSRIVSLQRILELRTIENREYIVKLSDGSQHRCSRTYAARIDSWLRANC